MNISLLDKIKHFFGILASNEFSLVIVLIFALLALFIILSCKMNDKLMKFFYVITYVSLLGFIVYLYYEQFLNLFDYLVETIVSNILFPNLAVYMGVLLFANIITLFTIFSSKVKDYVKCINIVSFSIMQLFLYLIVENVVVNNVNVYEKLSIYTNQDLLVLVELNMQIFVIWIFVLIIIGLIDHFMGKSEVKVKEVVNERIIINEPDINYASKENKVINDVSSLTVNHENTVVLEDNYYEDYYEFIEYVPIKKIKNVE